MSSTHSFGTVPGSAAPQRIDIFGLGNALVDKEFVVHDEFLQRHGIAKGGMGLIDEPRLQVLLGQLQAEFGLKGRGSGGSAANTLVTARQFGSSAYYACRVGADEAGHFYLADLQAAGVATNVHCRDGASGGATGRCLVMITPDAERTMNTYLGITGDLSAAEIDFDVLARSRLLYIEGYLVTSPTALQAAQAAKAFARERGIEVAYTLSDTSMVQYFREGVQHILGDDGVDLLFCNESEALQWSGAATAAEAVPALQRVARKFCVTLGARGALVFDGEQLRTVAAVPAAPVDTNGAGDVFAGGFLHGYAAGWGCERAARLGAAAAARCVSQFGPRLGAAEQAGLLQHWLAASP